MEGYCRCCLTKHEDTALLLQYTEKNRRLYTYSTGLQIKLHDPLFLMCKHCAIKMKLACKFKKQCRTSDKKLTHFLALREAGEHVDFEVFLKNYNDSFPLKFLHNGSSTPFQEKLKDDDAESTCTSIQNFMTDILQAEDLPDGEAQIIQEMIQKEADVLDDSLDSHWLQDNASIVTEFRFSPFSTPHSQADSLDKTPIKKEDDNGNEDRDSQSFDEETYIAAKKLLLKTSSPIENHQRVGVTNLDPILSMDNEISFSTNDGKEEELPKNIEDKENDKSNVNDNQYCIGDTETQLAVKQITGIAQKEEHNDLEADAFNNSNVTVCDVKVKDRIDKNLEEALKDENNEVFPLDALIAIATPSVKSGVSGVGTPLIADILFGDRIDDGQTKKHVYCTEETPDTASEVDVLEEFFNKETGDYIGDKKKEDDKEIFGEFVAPEAKIAMPPVKAKYDLSDFSCKICVKNFKSVRCLKIHFAKVHKFKIETVRKPDEKEEVACECCGKIFVYRSNLRQHIRTVHQKPDKKHECNKCSLEFSSAAKLKMHMVTHTAKKDRKFQHANAVCNICGHQSTSLGNLKVHMARHNKEYAYTCGECGKKYYRKTDLTVHLRVHTGETPYACKICDLKFKRQDSLNIHMKRHTAERPYKCIHCGRDFCSGSALNFHVRNSALCLKKRTERAIEDDKPPEFEVTELLIVPENSKVPSISMDIDNIEENASEIELPDFKDAENLYDELSEALKDAA